MHNKVYFTSLNNDLFHKNNTEADDEGNDEKAGNVETFLFVTHFVPDIEQFSESDDGDVQYVVASGGLKQ